MWQRCGAALLFSQNFGRLDNNERLRGAAPVRAYHVLMVTIDAEIPSNPRKDGYAQTREMHGLCDRPTDQESAREPMPFKPNHQIRPIQINALSKTRLVRSYLTGGKPSGENGSHAHGYRALCRSKERRGPIPFCLCKRRFTSRGNRVRASGREDTTCLTSTA